MTGSVRASLLKQGDEGTDTDQQEAEDHPPGRSDRSEKQDDERAYEDRESSDDQPGSDRV
ncbi:hypothetical protein [Natrinema salinisoli]|uniref:hypothetical protein n=1 Tax=Natrinema salinisoli TaxID=2878535 RepID=UPI001CF01208|nr:hypothetical protein [Natrinema salinisoli]